MGILKIARPINKAKNIFVQWLKDRGAKNIEIYEGEADDGFQYNRCISAFIGESLYVVYFEMYDGRISISYKDEENKYDNMSIDDFTQLIK